MSGLGSCTRTVQSCAAKSVAHDSPMVPAPMTATLRWLRFTCAPTALALLPRASDHTRPTTAISAASGRLRGSDEGAEAGQRTADDEVVDLPGALVGVQGLRVVEEAHDVVLEQDSVATEQLPRPAHGLPGPGGDEDLRQRGMVVAEDASLLQLGHPDGHAEAGGHVAGHPGDEVLDQLEAGDRPAELHPLLGVGE